MKYMTEEDLDVWHEKRQAKQAVRDAEERRLWESEYEMALEAGFSSIPGRMFI